MKRFFLPVVLIAPLLLASCSAEVDLYADGKDLPVVYGLLDALADTNYIKITHTLQAEDNPLAAAADPLQSDYPGKLDVRLTEFCNGDSLRQIVLDTITIHNKQDGLFYAPAQKLYYTTEQLHLNTPASRYRYRLTVALPDRTLVADADMVGSSEFKVRSGTADFSGGFPRALSDLLFLPAENAGVYDISMAFTFFERRTFSSDTVKCTLQWPLGGFYAKQLAHQMDEGACKVRYRHADLYDVLENSLGDDTLVPGLKRFVTDYPITVTIQAGGEHLAQYRYYYNLGVFNAEGDFSVIDGASGVFSSKMTITKRLRLGGTTIPDLVRNTNWGFVFIGGD